MNWSNVGDWVKSNAGAGASLVGSLLTGNIPGAVAAGVSMISGATGSDDPAKALNILQTNPDSVLKLKELYFQNEDSIRQHIEQIHKLDLEDKQAAHHETQQTIRAGDNAEDSFVRRTRPAQSWISLLAALCYVFMKDSPDPIILGALLTLPWAYAGLRQVGKGIDSFTTQRSKKANS